MKINERQQKMGKWGDCEEVLDSHTSIEGLHSGRSPRLRNEQLPYLGYVMAFSQTGLLLDIF